LALRRANRTAFALGQTDTERDDQRLPQRMRVPGRAGTRLKRNDSPPTRAGASPANGASIRTDPVKYASGPFPEGRDPLRVICILSLQFDIFLLLSI
jgi:hypothetical protein